MKNNHKPNYKKNFRIIISILIGGLALIGVFFLNSFLFNLIISPMKEGDLKSIVRVIWWIFTIPTTFAVGIVCGILFGSLIKIWLSD